MSRPVWRTTITVLVLCGLYRGYAALVLPVTALRTDLPMPARASTMQIRPPSRALEVVAEHLPELPWVQQAKYKWQRSKEAFLYFEQWRLVEDPKRNKVRFTPFALVWFDPSRDDQEPYTLHCSSAMVEFESTFELKESDPGRIIWGALQGMVHLTGPDGLQIHGKDFIFSEEEQRLYSFDVVQFAFGPQPGGIERVRGEAEQVEITLHDAAESLLSRDLPHVGGLQQFLLRRNVALELTADQDGRAVPVLIRSDGQFAYDVRNMVATFEDRVRVARPTHEADQPEQFDRLLCDRLTLIFEPEQADDAELVERPHEGVHTVSAGRRTSSSDRAWLDLDLKLEALQALGTVHLQSDENALVGRLQELYYRVGDRRLELRDPEGVHIQYRADELISRQIELTHDAAGRMQTVDCEGSGRAFRRNPGTGLSELDASWTERLAMAPDAESPWTRLEIRGDARVVQPSQQTGIIADVLQVWLDQHRLDPPENTASVREPHVGLDDGPPIRRVVAQQTGDQPVAMASPTMQLETSELEAVFVSEAASADGPAPSDRSGTTDLLPPSPAEESGAPTVPVLVKSGRVQVQVAVSESTGKADVAHLEATENVDITRVASREPAGDARSWDGPFRIEADRLILQTTPAGRVLKLLGAPARIRHVEAVIEGKELLFDQSANVATVEGRGTLIVQQLRQDFDGQTLSRPRPLSIQWQDRMSFDGRVARFAGNVKTDHGGDNVLLSQSMAVTLNRQIRFDDARSDQSGLELAHVVCQGNVEANRVEWNDENRPVGFRILKAQSFELDRGTGEFRALGPGRIYDWRLGEGDSGGRFHLQAGAVGRANQAATSDTLPWNYTGVEFTGDLVGNQHDRFVTLQKRVRVIHGPVGTMQETIDRHVLSDDTEQADSALWLQSEELRVTLLTLTESPQPRDYFQVIAWGDAEVEGRRFRARAHSISYDESKELFTLKGRGTEAGLWHQDTPGAPYREMFSRTIQFVPSKMLTVDGTTGIRVVQ